MRGTGAAEGDQREVARVDAALGHHRQQRRGHVGGGNLEDGLGRFLEAELKLRRDLANSRFGQLAVKLHRAAEKIVRIEVATDDVGVCHRRFGVAVAVGGGAGHGAGAFRADLEQADGIKPGNRPAAGADRKHIDRGHHHRIGADPGFGGVRRLAVADQRHVGAGAADVYGHRLLHAHQPGDIGRTDHARGGA